MSPWIEIPTHTKQLLLVTLCDTIAGIEASFWTLLNIIRQGEAKLHTVPVPLNGALDQWPTPKIVT